LDDKLRRKKQVLIESVNDILMCVGLEPLAAPLNTLVHSMAGLAAYHIYDAKPCVFVKLVHAEFTFI
jgi:hypothetical protein